MLIGSTFAWFTDSASTGVNTIQAGNLDVEFYRGEVNSENKIDTDTELFHVDKWEPGVVSKETLTVVNEGNLALKYIMTFSNLVAGTDYNFVYDESNPSKSLLDVLYVYIANAGTVNSARARSLTTSDGVKLKDFLDNGNSLSAGNLLANETVSKDIAIYWPQTLNDNEYNINNGKTVTALGAEQQTQLVINFKLTLEATQLASEYDSFDNEYDMGATIDGIALPSSKKDISTIDNNNYVIKNTAGTEDTKIPTGVAMYATHEDTTAIQDTSNGTLARDVELEDNLGDIDVGISFAFTNDSETVDVKKFGQVLMTPVNIGKNRSINSVKHNGIVLDLANNLENNADNKYYYDSNTGVLYIWSSTYSTFNVVFNDVEIKDSNGNIIGMQLAAFRDSVNNGESYREKTVTLLRNVNLNNEEWTPIGQKEGYKFDGVFDGADYKIVRLKISPRPETAKETVFDGYVGLFGAIDGGTVKNLTVSGSVEGVAAAGVVARMDSGLVENCTSYVTVTGTKDGKAGGIICLTNTKECIIRNCKNYGSVSGATTGGVAGIAAYVNANTTIDNCINDAEIGAVTDKYSGGIVGYLKGSDQIIIKNCTNNKNVKGFSEAGGIVGIVTAGDNKTPNIIYCSNAGDINAGDNGNGGGIAGSTYSATIEHCKNTATVYGKFAGGVVGNDAKSTIKMCSGGKKSITSPAYNLGFTGPSFTLNVPANGSSGRILGSHQGAGPDKYTLLILDDNNGDDNTTRTVGICGNTTTMPLLKIQSGTFYGDPLAGNGSAIFLEEGAVWDDRTVGKYCRGGVTESSRIKNWTLQG